MVSFPIDILTTSAFPGIGFEWLGPNVDTATAELRAAQLSQFMHDEIHRPVYENEFGLTFVDSDPPSGTAGDIPWRIEQIANNNTPLSDGAYREYLVALDLNEEQPTPEGRLAIAGLLVVVKPS